MSVRLVGIYGVGWIGMAGLAILNGVIRETLYGPFMGALSAHQVSTCLGILLFGLYIWFFMGFFPVTSSGQALYLGLMWLVMTLCFECLFGLYVVGHSWGQLLHDYNLCKGQLWVLVVIWIGAAPYLFYRMH